MTFTADNDLHPGANSGQQFGGLQWRRSRTGEVEILLIATRRTGRWILPRGSAGRSMS